MNFIHKHRAITFGIILILCSWWLFIGQYILLGMPKRTSMLLANTLCDTLIAALPYFIVPRKWRNAVWVIFPLLTVLFEVNILYFRNFDDIPGPAALFSGDAFNVFTIKGAADSFRPSDLLYIFAPLFTLIAAGAAMGRRLSEARKFPPALRVAAAATLLACPFARYALDVRRNYIWYKEGCLDFEYVMPITEFQRTRYKEVSQFTLYARLNTHGLLPYLQQAVTSVFPSTLTLTADDKAFIAGYLQANARSSRPASASNKNLILIIVESWNSTTLDRSDAMPFLTGLIGTEGTLAAPRLESQISLGRSSDGQFILTTGLLPLRDEPLVANYAATAYPALPKLLKEHTSIEVIGESARLWHHNVTNRSYGYGAIIADVITNLHNADSLILSRAAQVADSLPEPFMMTVTTVSMHDPYNENNTSTTYGSPGDGLDIRDRNYLAECRHLDNAMKSFISSLKADSLYDNTVIAITGDHHVRESALSPAMVCHTVPLLILNSGVTRTITETANQVDVFPTLLDIMGVDSRYRGVGRSLTADSIPRPTPEEAWRVSELLIRARCDANFLENLY